MLIALNGQTERAAEGSDLLEGNVSQFWEAEPEIAEPEQTIRLSLPSILQKLFRQMSGALAPGRDKLQLFGASARSIARSAGKLRHPFLKGLGRIYERVWNTLVSPII